MIIGFSTIKIVCESPAFRPTGTNMKNSNFFKYAQNKLILS